MRRALAVAGCSLLPVAAPVVRRRARGIRLLGLGLGLLLAVPLPAAAQWFPTERKAISVGLSFGTVNLNGADDSHPPKGQPPLWAVRVAVPVTGTFSIDGEFARSGVVDGGSRQSFFRERRRDSVAAVYARLDLWRKGIVAVHPIVGVSVVKPSRQVMASTFDAATGQWTEQRVDEAEYPDYPHTWALSWGTDVWIGTGHIAVVPEFRAHEHFSNPSPFLSARILRTVSGSIGLRYRF